MRPSRLLQLSAVACLGSLTISPVAAQSDRLVLLVRHAEAAAEPRADPPLSPVGEARAAALALALAGVEIRTVIVSPRARTALTGAAIAAARGLTPVTVDLAGGIPGHVEGVAAAVRAQPAGAPVLVIGHSNTIPAVIAALGGPRLPDLCHGEFSRLFVLHLRSEAPPSLVSAAYGAPDAEGASTCP